MKNKAFIFGRIILTTVRNASGAPFIDECGGTTMENKPWKGYAIQLNPFKFNEYGKRKVGLCLCIGLLTKLNKPYAKKNRRTRIDF